MNKVDEAKFCSSVLSTFEVLTLQHVVKHHYIEELGCFRSQRHLQMLQFSVYLIGLLSRLLRRHDFTGIQKVVVDQTNRRPPNSGHDLSLGQDWLWEVLWSFLLVQLLSQVSLVVMCKQWVMHITIQLRNGSLLCRIGEDTSKKNPIFLIWG